jgi:hypothetical protein
MSAGDHQTLASYRKLLAHAADRWPSFLDKPFSPMGVRNLLRLPDMYRATFEHPMFALQGSVSSRTILAKGVERRGVLAFL